MKTILRTTFAPFCLAMLTACGGGGGGGGDNPAASNAAPPSPLLSSTEIRRIQATTEAAPPVETEAQLEPRALSVVERTERFYVSDLLTNNPDGSSVTAAASCSGTSCNWRLSRTGSPYRAGFGIGDEMIPVLTKHAITLFEERGRREEGDLEGTFRTYGGWLDHSAFRVVGAEVTRDETSVHLWYGAAIGDLTEAMPQEVSATWTGLMVGSSERFGKNEVLQGDATLVWTGGGEQTLDAAFTDIVNVDQHRPYFLGIDNEVRFDGVPVASDGTFEDFSGQDTIHGAFFGPNAAEAAGAFFAEGIVGAFGARKQ